MTKAHWLAVGVLGIVSAVLGLGALVPAVRRAGAGTGGVGASEEVCTRCSRAGHGRTACPYTVLATQCSQVAVQLDRARAGRFCDGSANTELGRDLNQAVNAGLKITAAYGQPPPGQAPLKTLLELLQTLRAQAQDDFKDTAWRELRDHTAALQDELQPLIDLREAAGRLRDWIAVQKRAADALRAGAACVRDNQDEDACRKYAQVPEDSVYAGDARRRRVGILVRLKESRTRAVDARAVATEYEAALKLIDETLDLFGTDCPDFTAELLARQAECRRFVGTQRILDEGARCLERGDFDAARSKLDGIEPGMSRVPWVRKRVDALRDAIETQSLLARATRLYDEGQGEAAVRLLSSRIDQIGEAGRRLLDRIQKVVMAHKEMMEFVQRNDWKQARPQADATRDLEKSTGNRYRQEAESVIARVDGFLAGCPGPTAYDLAVKARSEGDALEAGAKVLFDAGKTTEALARCDEAAKKFAGARDALERAKLNSTGNLDEIRRLSKDAEKAYNLNRNARLPVERRLGLLRIALAKLSAIGENEEKALRAQIAGLIDELEADRNK